MYNRVTEWIIVAVVVVQVTITAITAVYTEEVMTKVTGWMTPMVVLKNGSIRD